MDEAGKKITKLKTHRSGGPYYGGIDAGGTKFLCCIGRSHADYQEITTIKTRDPSQTLPEVARFFNHWIDNGNQLASLGICTFGPLVRDPDDQNYGHLRNSPKSGWHSTNVGGGIGELLKGNIPWKIDTDVNGAALAEQRWGAAVNKNHFAYVTVGTGIGVAIYADGRLVNGIAHSELGHFRPARPMGDLYHRDFTDSLPGFKGICPFHGDCLEGLASGPAIQARTGQKGEALKDSNPVWSIIAHYLASLSTTILLGYGVERIIFGGGVMRRTILYEMIRKRTKELLNGYLSHPLHAGDLTDVIVPSAFSNERDSKEPNAGVLGGFILAEEASKLGEMQQK